MLSNQDLIEKKKLYKINCKKLGTKSLSSYTDKTSF